MQFDGLLSTKILRTPDERFENLPDWPYEPNYVEALPGYEGLRMHYVDAGPKDADTVFLCLHGQPSWSYLYRKMIPVFTDAGHRVIAPDLFGFGRSDKPVDDEVYGYYFHRNALIALVDYLELDNIVLVVHDWGGILGLTLPKDVPSRYKKLLVMNTFLPIGRKLNPAFAAWRAYCRANPDLDIASLMKRNTGILSDDEVAAYAAPFPSIEYKAGIRRFPEMVMTLDGEMEGLDTSFAAQEFFMERWAGQSLMGIGMQDPVVSVEEMYHLHKIIRNCPDPFEIKEAGHYVPEWGVALAQAALKEFKLT